MPKLSVIMSVYGESLEQLKRSIDSIIDQSYRDFEFIIVLDNPQNVEAKKYIASREKQDQKIVFLENEKNIKLGASLNRGISSSRGKYIARMDGDDVCDASKLEKQNMYLEKSPDVDILFTGWEEVDELGNKLRRIPSKQDFQDIQKTFFYKSPLLHASMMGKREIFEKYKYPEIDRPEDFSLFLDLIHAGYRFDILEENLYTFYVQTQDVEKKYMKIRTFSSNYLMILRKNISKYWKNIFFWWMFLLVTFQWILSRNKWIFALLFERLQGLYKKLFIANARK